MKRTTLIFASLLAMWASPAFAQVIVTARPVVSYYAPPVPVVNYSPTVYSSPIVTPTVVASPVVVNRPVTTYYAPAIGPAPVSTYYAPAYAPVTTFYGGPVVTPVVGRPVVVGRSVYGTLTPYVAGQPVRNALRFTLP